MITMSNATTLNDQREELLAYVTVRRHERRYR
jgi:hypothetical protein